MTPGRMPRVRGAAVVAIGLAAWLGACGSRSSPSAPTPPPPPPAVNNPPVIQSIAVDRARVEVDEQVAVSATVTDAETPVDRLTFEWTADAGTFTGSGASVTWRAPKDQTTPQDYVLNVKVTEQYGTPDASGQRPQNTVTGTSPAVRVHDSVRENGDMALRFLRDFANSSVPPQVALREFSRACEKGHDEEYTDIESNRLKFLILSSRLTVRSVRVASSQLSATTSVACSFESKRLVCLPEDGPTCKVGVVESGSGNCELTSVYEDQHWALCTSLDLADPASAGSMKGFWRR